MNWELPEKGPTTEDNSSPGTIQSPEKDAPEEVGAGAPWGQRHGHLGIMRTEFSGLWGLLLLQAQAGCYGLNRILPKKMRWGPNSAIPQNVALFGKTIIADAT